ncbi:Srtx-1 [Aphelenchoides besseyi]|nr:Srtx-1 [Aphelenchoides besseyi]
MQPSLLFEVLPAFAFLLIIANLSYVWFMRSRQSDVFAVMYALHVFDLLMGLSLFYAGFHGSAIAATTDDNTRISPWDCAFRAPHLSAWVILDVASAAVLLVFCLDQVISVIWSKKHKNISGFYLQPGMMLLVFLLSFSILIPTWDHALKTAENKTITISPFCSMSPVLDGFYQHELNIRLYVPILGLGILILAATILLGYQLSQEWQFKWSDNNAESVCAYNFAVLRCSLMALAAHLPIWILRNPRLNEIDEILLRMVLASVLSLLQPIGVMWLFPEYLAEMRKFFAKYSHGTKRTWQSADDPPTDQKSFKQAGLDFGSFYSSGGNVIGEFGVPFEVTMDASKQRSISFYYQEGVQRY